MRDLVAGALQRSPPKNTAFRTVTREWAKASSLAQWWQRSRDVWGMGARMAHQKVTFSCSSKGQLEALSAYKPVYKNN